MKLHPDVVVKTDSKAIIKFTGLMGQNYIAIDFGSPDAPTPWTGRCWQPRNSPILTRS